MTWQILKPFSVIFCLEQKQDNLRLRLHHRLSPRVAPEHRKQNRTTLLIYFQGCIIAECFSSYSNLIVFEVALVWTSLNRRPVKRVRGRCPGVCLTVNDDVGGFRGTLEFGGTAAWRISFLCPEAWFWGVRWWGWFSWTGERRNHSHSQHTDLKLQTNVFWRFLDDNLLVFMIMLLEKWHIFKFTSPRPFQEDTFFQIL